MELAGLQMPSLSSDGAQVVTQTFVSTPQVAAWKSRKHEAIAGQTNFFDIAITTEIRLSSGEYMIDNLEDVHPDDYIELSLIDKNNVLGLFSYYGLQEGDVLELFKFVRTEFPITRQKFESPMGCTHIVVPGLFIRVAYVSFGTTNINFKTRILWYE